MSIGILFRLKTGNPTSNPIPWMEILSKESEREDAKWTAKLDMESPDWDGPKQVLFMRRDGSVEVWDYNSLA